MPKSIALDTGPLVALFNQRDSHHTRSLAFFQRSTARFFTSLAVITEAFHLLDFRSEAQRDLLQWIRAGAMEVIAQHPSDWDRIIELVTRYADLPCDFADASLVAICERLETRQVATIDSDFRVYRFQNRRSFENVFLD